MAITAIFILPRKRAIPARRFCTKQAPLSVRYGLGLDEHDHEGRLITDEYPEFYLVCCYTPNSQDGLKRLPYRMEWEDALRAYLLRLDAEKPVVYCGDLNVAHEEIDIKNPKANRQNAGFSDEERAKMTRLRPLALPTRSAVCTRIWRAYTRGGVTASMRAKITQAGVLTILLSPNGCAARGFIGNPHGRARQRPLPGRAGTVRMTQEEFTARYMPQFSEQQKAAVMETEGPVLLLAVPEAERRQCW